MNPLMQVKSLRKEFLLNKGLILTALNHISFEIFKGETLGLVGESGCGKSTLGRCLVQLQEPTSGEVLFEGQNIIAFSRSELFSFRRKIQMIFQDPYTSLNPRMTAEEIISEPLKIHRLFSEESKKEIDSLLDRVGLSRSSKGRFPHEFSGGQRQRIVIARALTLKPQLIICDEPMSALDVSIQAQIANLLKDLQKELNLTYLFISHDLAMVKYMADRVAVMHQGSLVEIASTPELYRQPVHTYTKELLKQLMDGPLLAGFEKRQSGSGSFTMK